MTLSREILEDFLRHVMDIERKYDLDLRHVNTARQGDIKQLVEKYCAENFDDED